MKKKKALINVDCGADEVKTKFNNFEKYNEQIETLNDLYDEMETE